MGNSLPEFLHFIPCLSLDQFSGKQQVETLSGQPTQEASKPETASCFGVTEHLSKVSSSAGIGSGVGTHNQFFFHLLK